MLVRTGGFSDLGGQVSELGRPGISDFGRAGILEFGQAGVSDLGREVFQTYSSLPA